MSECTAAPLFDLPSNCLGCGRLYFRPSGYGASCSVACMSWAKRHPGEMRPTPRRPCIVCDRIFLATRTEQVTCGEGCKQFDRANPGVKRFRQDRCTGCGKELVEKRAVAKVCSKRCWDWARRHPGEMIPSSRRCIECDGPIAEARFLRGASCCSHRCNVRQWKKKNPERFYAVMYEVAHRRRTKQRIGSFTLAVDAWLALVERFEGQCAYCGDDSDVPSRDHVVPIALGGRHEISNLLPACLDCNRKKNARLLSVWVAKRDSEDQGWRDSSPMTSSEWDHWLSWTGTAVAAPEEDDPADAAA